jgi:NADPH:quinone reductase-like Zn-dependent oxidoreductase
MKAIIIDPRNAKTISLEERPIPQPGDGEVLVRLVAAGFNHRDVLLYNGWDIAKEWPPVIAGSDGAGIVHAVGTGVTEFAVGDEVALNALGDHGFLEDGTFAEYVKVPSENLFKKPKHLTLVQAATLPVALGTAWRVLFSRAKLQPGETLLVQGIGGGVAQFALQLAVAYGAKVIVTSSSDEKLALAKEMGAWATINYKKEDVAARVKELTDGQGAHVAIDGAGKGSVLSTLGSIPIGGRVVIYGLHTGDAVFGTKELVREITLMMSSMYSEQELADALAFMEKHQIVPVVSKTFPLEAAKEALEYLENAQQFGKIALRIAAQ